MKTAHKLILAAAAFVCAGSFAHADLLAGWGFPNGSGWDGLNPNIPASLADSNLGSPGGVLSFEDSWYEGAGLGIPAINRSSTNYDPDEIFTDTTAAGSLYFQSVPIPGNEIYANGKGIYFTLNSPGEGMAFEDVTLSYYTSMSSSVTLTWSYSTTGIDGIFTQFVANTGIGSWNEFGASTDILDGGQAESLVLMAEISGLADGSRLYIDSLTINGTVAEAVPEPSTYALLAGTLVLAGVMIRSRRNRA